MHETEILEAKKYSGLYARIYNKEHIENKSAMRDELKSHTEDFLKNGGKIVEVGPVNEPHPTQSEINEVRAINKRFVVHYNYRSFEWHVTNGGNSILIFKRKAQVVAHIKHETEFFKNQKRTTR